MNDEKFQEAKEKINNASSIVFFTGAGVSAESGIATFRGVDGIWTKLKPEELANFDNFLKNPEMVWAWYKYRKEVVNESKPNPAHLAIAEAQKRFTEVTVITQNIDNLHRRAGSKTVYELHGNIQRNYCVKCGTFYNNDIDIEDKVPKCKCGGLIRPDIVWFGEMLPESEFELSEIASRNCDIFVIVGTSGVVYPAANMIFYAKESGAYIIEVNIERTEVSYLANASFFGKAGTVLPRLLELDDNSGQNLL
ncbi:MAG: NAD-dependent deacylase [Bacteroidota bacterium]|nr:NAD-dependent deacylase [Bacteroidota bacterium]